MKTFKTLSLVFMLSVLTLTITGCTKQPEPRVVTVTKEVEVYIPTKMKRPKIDCEFAGDGTTPIAKLIDCIVMQKRVIEAVTVEE